MGSEYTFYDYIDADGDGTNVIRSWLNSYGKDAKAFFIMVIRLLEDSPPPRFKDSVWGEPYTRPMENKKGENWDGFIEIRKTGSIQYRLIAKMQGRNVFLVTRGVHKDQNYTTDISCQTALKRVDQMITNPTRYRKEHEYN